jgi:3'-phosphoadenosine 5'-phosphosulfate sulfotransferase (PAPS reductase)/FAD synthetase
MAIVKNNIISVSGGKDSTALLLLAIERGAENMQAVFADTGHEHAQTYEYVQYLSETVYPIRIIRADFTEAIAGRRRMMERVISGEHKERSSNKYAWTPDVAKRALEFLHPTGNPFLDMCLVHGRFPSTKVRFCSEVLKRNPIIEQVQMPLLDLGQDVVSWQGVRADESLARRDLPETDVVGGSLDGGTLSNYRPILTWKVEDVFAIAKRHGVKPNRLYSQGMGRVGCMPCIHARKDELLEISKRFPDEVARIERWEALIATVSKTSTATFFTAVSMGALSAADITVEKHGILAEIEWAKTGRGGRTLDMFRSQNDGPQCSSIYGLCE